MRKIFPNILTVLRVFAIPAVVLSFYQGAQFVTLVIFMAACITDFFDGYLARRWGVRSKFGRIFDPAADKLVVIATLVMLIHASKITGLSVIFVVIIVCREVFVSSMREFMIASGIGVPVNGVGKLKAATQIVAASLLILNDELVIRLGEVFLCIAATLSVYSMFLYTKSAVSKINNT